MWRGNEGQRAFSCIEYAMACRVAGPQGIRFRHTGILERMRIQESRPHTHTGAEACCSG
jgi:hypothetical protein